MNNLYNRYNNFLLKIIPFIEIITYTIAVLIISISIVKGFYLYIINFNNFNYAYNEVRFVVGESLNLALTFILSIEILKFFYIKSYKQLIIIVSLSLLKLLIGYYIDVEISNKPTSTTTKKY
jgi:uncharacterized membrane protein